MVSSRTTEPFPAPPPARPDALNSYPTEVLPVSRRDSNLHLRKPAYQRKNPDILLTRADSLTAHKVSAVGIPGVLP